MAAWMRLLRPLLPAPALPQIPDREVSVRVGPVSQLELRQRHNALRALAATFAAHACACMSVPDFTVTKLTNVCMLAWTGPEKLLLSLPASPRPELLCTRLPGRGH